MRTDAGAARVHVQDDLERVLIEALLLLDVVVLAVDLRLAFEDLVQAELLDAAAVLLIVVSSKPLLKLLVVNRHVASPAASGRTAWCAAGCSAPRSRSLSTSRDASPHG